jgi:hypothetical protein
MDPRPYYSSRPTRRFMEKCESALRWRVKVALIRSGRTHRWTDLETFENALRRLVLHLEGRGARVIIVGPPDLEERYFPGSNLSLQQYAQVARRVGGEYVPLVGRLDRWDDYCSDRFHPNEAGHLRVARILLAHLAPGSIGDGSAQTNEPTVSS